MRGSIAVNRERNKLYSNTVLSLQLQRSDSFMRVKPEFPVSCHRAAAQSGHRTVLHGSRNPHVHPETLNNEVTIHLMCLHTSWHHAGDAQSVGWFQQQATVTTLLTSCRFQRPDGLVQRSLLGDVDVELWLVIRHHAVASAVALTAHTWARWGFTATSCTYSHTSLICVHFRIKVRTWLA